jgi:MoaA/NifB/PqqE/SkfB family radical SAM enzyme
VWLISEACEKVEMIGEFSSLLFTLPPPPPPILRNSILLKQFIAKIKPIKNFYLKNIKGYDGFVRIYPTLKCNLRCTYCANECHKNNGEDKKGEYEEVDFRIWADALKKIGHPIIITGGEPTLYPQLIELLNALSSSKLMVKLYTNLVWSREFTNKFITKMKNENVTLFVSYHSLVSPQKFAETILLLKNNNKFMGTIHTILQEENADRVNTAIKLFENSGISVYTDENLDYEYYEAVSQTNRRKVKCSKKIFIIAPDGNRYQCVSKMLRKKEPLENIFNEKCKELNPQITSICYDYGACANCDMLGNTKIKKL